MLFEKSNKELLAELNRRVYGHEEAKKALISLVARSKMRHYQKFNENVPEKDLLEPSKILLLGDSGTGKTFLVEQLRDMLDFPLLELDATQLTPSGCSDGINRNKFTKMTTEAVEFWRRERSAKGYTTSVEGARDQLVIYIDEIDKLATAFDSSGNWNKHVQSNFLTLFDQHGEEAGGVSFIFSGAFANMTVSETKRSLGFNSVSEEITTEIDDAIIKYGLIPEFVGRLTSIIQLDKFNEDDYKYILNNILMPKKQHALSFFNSSLNLTEEDKLKMIKKAVASGQGIRNLKRQLDRHSLELEFNYEEVQL